MSKESEADVNNQLSKKIIKKDDYNMVCNERTPLDLADKKPQPKLRPGKYDDPSSWSIIK